MRPSTRSMTYARTPAPRPKKRGARRAWFGVIVIILGIVAFHFGTSHADTTENAIHSGVVGTCLDVLHSGITSGTPIDIAICNGSAAQDWVTNATTIRQMGTNSCVTATSKGAIILSNCTQDASQVWLRDQQGYFNPNTTKCLSATTAGTQLQLGSCSNMSWNGVVWTLDSHAQAPACTGSQGATIACDAIAQWTAWQAANASHESLLTSYTDGTPYEEWCADFVSYVYKEAGYPFTNGSADGWDENDANRVQYMGFTIHQASSGYVPKAGDVAFFNYPGGHVEIVVSGGTKPTFVYGDSAQVDPTTGNGQMKANTILQDGEEGSVVYYMSPSGA